MLLDVGPSTPPAAAQQLISTPYEAIPSFGQNPTIWSVRSGSWSDPSVWSAGRVPADGDVVRISGSTAVLLDLVSAARLDTVRIEAGGALRFRADVNTQLLAANFLVLDGGELEIGSAASPVAASATAKVVVANRPIDTIADPSAYGNGLLAFGRVTMHGSPKLSFTRLAAEPRAGSTLLRLSEPAAGWLVGDQLILPDTRQLDWNEHGANYVSQAEVATVATISADGLAVTLGSPLLYDHLGARDGGGAITFLPHVANLTRNVVVRSESGTGTRGHVMFLGRADVDVAYARFLALGRTTLAAPDDTTYNPDGSVLHLGTNQEDRTAVQFRHLIGPTPPRADGFQFSFVGNVVTCPLKDHSFIWPVDINDSHFGLLRDNVVDNWSGAGFVTRTGAETGNRIEHNLVSRVRGTGQRDNGGRDGAGYWFRGPDNAVINNIATGIPVDDYGYGYVVNARYLGTVRVPAYRGADPSQPGQAAAVDMNATPLREFAGNEVYGATTNGLSLWWLGTYFRTPVGTAGVVKDFRAWHVRNWGYFGYESNALTLDGFVALGDTTGRITGYWPTGMWFADYQQRGLVIRGANIQGMGTGIEAPMVADGTTRIEGGYLRNKVNVDVMTMNSVGGPDLPARRTELSGTTFAAPAGQPLISLNMSYQPTGGANLVQSDSVAVLGYNGVAGDDFQVFYTQQAQDFVVPQSNQVGSGIIGSPEAGLTNGQNMQKYGIAIAGAMTPCLDVASHPEINGFTCSAATGSAPTIASQPQSASVTEGQPFSLTIQASGTAPLAYQWFKNGSPLAGSTGGTYSITAASLSDAGTYAVSVTNALGSAMSQPATVAVGSVSVAPSITSQPKGLTVTAGQPASFSIGAAGTGPLYFQWLKDGSPIAGATATSYQIAATSTASAGNYSVVVRNASGAVTSVAAKLTVKRPRAKG